MTDSSNCSCWDGSLRIAVMRYLPNVSDLSGSKMYGLDQSVRSQYPIKLKIFAAGSQLEQTSASCSRQPPTRHTIWRKSHAREHLHSTFAICMVYLYRTLNGQPTATSFIEPVCRSIRKIGRPQPQPREKPALFREDIPKTAPQMSPCGTILPSFLPCVCHRALSLDNFALSFIGAVQGLTVDYCRDRRGI